MTESFFDMLQDYRPTVLGELGTDQRSPGPTEYFKGKILNVLTEESNVLSITSDLDAKSDSNCLWMPDIKYQFDVRCTTKNSQNYVKNDSLIILHSNPKPQTSQTSNKHIYLDTSTLSICTQEPRKRQAFEHYDCQSLTASLSLAAKVRDFLKISRHNTTAGASAASMSNLTPINLHVDAGQDHGDGNNNELLESCPFFRNEVGFEEERMVSLTRMSFHQSETKAVHCPAIAYGINILESDTNGTLWNKNVCSFKIENLPIETMDNGARYYSRYFYGKDHQNWFGTDDQLGPLAISVMKEKINGSKDTIISQVVSQSVQQQTNRFRFRLIIRTSELLTLRGSIIEDFIPNPRVFGRNATTKEVLEFVAPEIQLNCLRLGVSTGKCQQQLIKLDEQGLTNMYKVGILYCCADQFSEEDMYNNEKAGPYFTEFLDLIGTRVRLKGFQFYKAGLDTKTDSTGFHSLYASYQDCEIMFHVSTMLPFTRNNRQQLLRKRHIGNDIVTIVFQEPGALPFSPKSVRSQFQHVFIVVRVINPGLDSAHYRVSVSRSKDVPVFGPPLPCINMCILISS